MSTYNEAGQVHVRLKMLLSQYAWYSSSLVVSASDGYSVLVLVKRLDNQVRKVIPQVIDGVDIRTDLQ
jgi:hypothetical protein